MQKKEQFEEQLKGELEDLLDYKFNNNRFNELKESIQSSEYKDGNNPTFPGKPNLDKIASVTETAFQRAIFNGKFSNLNDSTKKIEWIDLELPVTLSSKSRRKCIDLIGLYEGNPILCELKYKNKSDGDRPEYAIFELLSYFNFVKWNFEKLDKHSVHHKECRDFRWEEIANHPKPTLIVAANKRYWKDWFNKNTHKGSYKDNLLGRIDALDENLKINICLFRANDEDFLTQKEKGDSGKYEPIVTSKIWHQIK